MTRKWPFSHLVTLIIMIPLVSFYSFSLDLYIPLLPSIGNDLGSNIQTMQYTNSLFMLFCGIGQIVFGPLSDHYGRLPTLKGSLIIFALANIICMYAWTFPILLLGRILQAIGACGSYLCCFATIRDIYQDENECAAMFSYLNIANSLSAICAPTLGTLLGRTFGWPSIFFVLGIAAICSLGYTLIAVETTSSKPSTLNLSQLITSYRDVFFHPNYQLFTLPAAIGFGTFFAYYCISPYLYIETMGFSKLAFSIFYGSCGITFLVGSYICGQLLQRIGILNTINIGLACHALGACLLLQGFWLTGSPNIYFIHPAVLLCIWGASFMVGAGIGGTMAPFKKSAGVAFAMISCYKFIAAHSLGDIVMHFYNNTPMSLGICILSLNALSCLLLWAFQNNIVNTIAQTADTPIREAS